jgi:hypothetical protein
MAHITEVVGTYSEVVAELALLANGYTVSRPRTAEPFDLKAECPKTGRELKVQVKTVRKRSDRNFELVVQATKGNGEIYTKSDVDVFVGVLAEEGEIPRVYMFENREIKEYWATESRAEKRWERLELPLNRALYDGGVTAIKPKKEELAI